MQGNTPVINDLSVEGGKIKAGTVGGVDTLAVSNVYFASGAFEFDFGQGVTNDIRFKISVENPASRVNGKFELTAANTNFTGAVTLLGTNLTYLTISDERNLGGNPPAFRADQLKLDCTGILQVATSVWLDDPNRGITLSRQGGILDVVSNGATLSVACPIAGTTLYKRGAGTLTLSGANAYSGGTIVEAGALQVGSLTALGTGPVTFDTALLSPQDTPSGYIVTVETRTANDGGTARTQVYLRYRWVGTLILVQ